MKVNVLKKKEILFRQGDPGDGLYYIHLGQVGIYTGYGTPNQIKIAELFTDEFVGEMGIISGLPRNATAVSLMDGTQVEHVTDAEFAAFYEKGPARVLQLMEQMSHRLRKITRRYLEECREAYTLVEQNAQAADEKTN